MASFQDSAREGNLEEVLRLLADGVDKDSKEVCSLMNNVLNNDLILIKIPFQSGFTALIWAALKGHFIVVQTLIDAGATTNLSNWVSVRC